ncbi:DUF6351 family protein [Pseudorhodoferax sp.]|uniref:DUF6351 family protein n=1 Tax=Pseudorhodoferax sp. TaxID=1993553 RepID=UPI002DD62CBA|nr:DUF6351 family protein [Pseudorhodoferax sp.]
MDIRLFLKAAGGLTGVAAGLALALPAAAVTAPEIHVLSNRADLVAGGDALVEIKWPAGANLALAKIALDGANVKSAFAMRPNGRYMGLVSGLKVGNNVLTARIPGGGAQITIKNHPIGGPVISGPQLEPWLCRTGNQGNPSLPGTPDAQCNVPTVVELFYRNASNQFVTYNPASPPAAEQVQQTTTDEGKTVPFIVQRVTGTANRGIYQISVLVDPTKPITPWSTEQPWNRKYYNAFGGACAINYQQPTVGNTLTSVTQLGRGFAVGHSSMNTLGNQCSDLLSAESLMMTKEIVTKRYGEIRYSIGEGGSAGSMQQHFIAEAYPGLLNGLTTSLVYDEHWGQVVGSADCMLLFRAFGMNQAGLGITGMTVNPLFPNAAERQKVWGSNPSNPDNLCGSKAGFIAAELIADTTQGCAGPAGNWRWHSVNNPSGTRCTIQDYLKAVFGVGPDGKAPTALDNVGVQYGLLSLLNGSLTPEQFVDINHRIGGLTIDGTFQPQRMQADPSALNAVHRTGRNVSGRGAAMVVEIDNRSNFTSTDFHPPFHSWTYRARMDRTNGNHAGHVIWVPNGGQTPNQFLSVDAWLAAVEADTSSDPLPTKIWRNRPETVFDACFRPGGVVLKDNLFCEGNGDWRFYASPRLTAGWAFTNDTLKCQLKPLAAADYPGITFTAEQWARLQETFPTGVCDWTKPGVGEQPSIPWLTYAGGPGGQPLGDPPKSTFIP